MDKHYPDGKLDNSDEGALKIATYIKDGRIVIDFGKEVSWLGFDKKTIRNLLDVLEDKYKQL